MPRNRSIQLYMIRFSLADGEHIAAAHADRWENEEQKKVVIDKIIRAMRPASAEYPNGNPDLKILDIKPVEHPDEINQAVAALNEANPKRVGAELLGLDTPNRVLHEPDITRNVAAANVVG